MRKKLIFEGVYQHVIDLVGVPFFFVNCSVYLRERLIIERIFILLILLSFMIVVINLICVYSLFIVIYRFLIRSGLDCC